MRVEMGQGWEWSYLLGLFKKPREDILATITGGGNGVSVSPSRLMFTRDNWSTPQAVSVWVHPNSPLGLHTLRHSASSSRPEYRSKKELSVEIVVRRHDDPRLSQRLPGFRMDLSVCEHLSSEQSVTAIT